MRTRSAHRKAFTLIEILVVVAIIALLIAILLPSLARARAQANGALCISNERQLMLAMQLYIQDFKVLPATQTSYYNGNTTPANRAFADGFTWSGLGIGSPTQSSTAAANWVQQFSAITPKRGTLFRFARDPKIYACPTDTSTGGNGILSYSMNAYIGLKSPDNMGFTFVADFTRGGTYSVIPAGTSIRWNPARMMVFFEEHPLQNLNKSGSAGRGDGNMTGTEGVIARHGSATRQGQTFGRTTVAFLDAHAEFKLAYKHPDFDYPNAGQFFNEMSMPYGSGANTSKFLAPLRALPPSP